MQSVSSPTASVVKSVKGTGKGRARMGGDKTPENAPSRKRKPVSTRVRTLKDMLNTMPEKKRQSKRDISEFSQKKKAKTVEESPAQSASNVGSESVDSSEADDVKTDGCVVATKSTVTSQKYFKGKGEDCFEMFAIEGSRIYMTLSIKYDY